jgi:hypothetical protein
MSYKDRNKLCRAGPMQCAAFRLFPLSFTSTDCVAPSRADPIQYAPSFSCYSNVYDPADKYHILRKDNAWEEISAMIKCSVKGQIIISINDEISIVLHRVMKQHWVSGTVRF